MLLDPNSDSLCKKLAWVHVVMLWKSTLLSCHSACNARGAERLEKVASAVSKIRWIYNAVERIMKLWIGHWLIYYFWILNINNCLHFITYPLTIYFSYQKCVSSLCGNSCIFWYQCFHIILFFYVAFLLQDALFCPHLCFSLMTQQHTNTNHYIKILYQWSPRGELGRSDTVKTTQL